MNADPLTALQERVDLDRLRELIQLHLVADPLSGAPSYATPARGYETISLPDALAGLEPELVTEIVEAGDHGWYEIVGALIPSVRPIIQCSNPGNRVSSEWGLGGFEIGDAAFHCEYPDPDNEVQFAILASHDIGDASVALVETHVRWWNSIGLPPMGDQAVGPPGPMLEAVDRILGRDLDRWQDTFFPQVCESKRHAVLLLKVRHT